jgi:hypothetical protein
MQPEAPIFPPRRPLMPWWRDGSWVMDLEGHAIQVTDTPASYIALWWLPYTWCRRLIVQRGP